jgi:glucose/arabinose dehydrogenase
MRLWQSRFTPGRFVLSIAALAVLLAACRGTVAPSPEAEPMLETQIVLPSQFQDLSVTAVNQPTGLAFTPDGRLLITELPGRLRVYKNGSQSVAAIDITSHYNLRVNVLNQGNYIFQLWSNGGAQSQIIKTPSGNASYIATFSTQ